MLGLSEPMTTINCFHCGRVLAYKMAHVGSQYPPSVIHGDWQFKQMMSGHSLVLAPPSFRPLQLTQADAGIN